MFARGGFGCHRLGLEECEFALLSNAGFESPAPRLVMLWHCGLVKPSELQLQMQLFGGLKPVLMRSENKHAYWHPQKTRKFHQSTLMMASNFSNACLSSGQRYGCRLVIADQVSGCLSAGWSLVWQCTPPPLPHELSISIT